MFVLYTKAAHEVKKITMPCLAPYKNALAILVCILILCPRSSATSIVIIITRQGIVIGADGKGVTSNRSSELTPKSGVITKIFLVHNRIAVAGAKLEYIGMSKSKVYDFGSLVYYLQANTATEITVTNLVTAIKSRLAEIFNGFDALLKIGKLHPEDFPNNQPIVEIFIAGYEDGQPAIYTVALNVDWKNFHLNAPAVIHFRPFVDRNNVNILDAGAGPHGIRDLKNRISTEQTKIIEARIPAEIKALNDDSPISMEQALALNRGLLDLEVLTNPEKVGYPLTIFSLNPSSAEKHTYSQQQK